MKFRAAFPAFSVLVATCASLSWNIGLGAHVLSSTASGRAPDRAPGILMLTGNESLPGQSPFEIPELADPYVTQVASSVVVSGTAQYHLEFRNHDDLDRGRPHQVIWKEFFYADGTPMEGGRAAHTWDMKPVLWARRPQAGDKGELWDPRKHAGKPFVIWYGGHMRPRAPGSAASWPNDNFSRDVFAFIEKAPGKWFSMSDSIFSIRGDWPRKVGNYLGHRYGSQIVPSSTGRPLIFYEQVVQVRPDGSPQLTSIFMDEMADPLAAAGRAIELISPMNSKTGKFYPSAAREDGSGLVEGPLYFKFKLDNELWEAIGFSAGSFYSRYPSCFAARRVSDGNAGKPFQLDLTDDGSDLHDAGLAVGKHLALAGGPGRPAVIIDSEGLAKPDGNGNLPLLFHAYRRKPEQPFSGFRTVYKASLNIQKSANGSLRFNIVPSDRVVAPGLSQVQSLRKPERSPPDVEKTFARSI